MVIVAQTSVLIPQVFTLLVVFQIKHFLADFPLQGKYMLGKFKTGTEWILPLAVHCAVHGLFTLLIIYYFKKPELSWLAAVDFAVHFTMDRIKASPHILGRFPITSRYYWWTLGFDQMVHHFTNYFIIWNLVKAS